MKNLLFVLIALTSLTLLVACHKGDSGCKNYKLTLNGSMNNCYGGNTDSGYVTVYSDGSPTIFNFKGSFSVVLNRCSASSEGIHVTVTDKNTGDNATDTSFLTDTGTINLNAFYACPLYQFVNLGQGFNITTATSDPGTVTYTNNYGRSQIKGEETALGANVTLLFGPFTTAGNFPLDTLYGTQSTGHSFYAYGGNITVTYLGAIGGFVRGNYSVPLHQVINGDTTAASTTTGYFQVIRQQ